MLKLRSRKVKSSLGLVLRQTDDYSDNLNNMRSRIKYISNKNRDYCVADKI
ncbi:hypothetical protein [Nostoc sp. UCD121]|uniref:hypothetical protein n=1 Tax=Nostoc sp. UCD121 TaxID=2681305 RepID=UPI001623CA08|nr:hypothetical protein [Nostoc sp. UCD121]